MADTDRRVELHEIAKGLGLACLYCGADRCATPDAEPHVGSVVFCGACAGMHFLEAHGVPPWEERTPYLEKPTPVERLELLRRPDVQAVRDAYQLDQMEARMTRAATKSRNIPTAPRTGGKVRPGLNRLEARGPDA